MTSGVCRKCGCTNESPCLITSDGTVVSDETAAAWTDEDVANFDGGPCSWIEPDLCSGCVEGQPPPMLYDGYGNPLRGAP